MLTPSLGCNSGVLALNFPARGRKRYILVLYIQSRLSFWPLISPQGDGNRIGDTAERHQAIVLALNFPARGRKLELIMIKKVEMVMGFGP